MSVKSVRKNCITTVYMVREIVIQALIFVIFIQFICACYFMFLY